MTTDVSCLIGERTEALAEEIFSMDVVPKASWYGPPTEDEILSLDGTVIDGRVMAQVVLCGENAGQFQSLVAEDGVPFTNGYEDLPYPILAGAEFGYINDRLENPITVVDADGNQISIAAGKSGFMHSPGPNEPGGEDIETIDDLLQWHDREWATVAMEGGMARYRLHEVEQDGKILLIARGSVTPGLTNGAVWAIAQSEVSPEFIPVEGEDGETYLEYVALSHVFHGNTNTTLSASVVAKLAAMMPKPAAAAKKFASLVRNVATTNRQPESEPTMADQTNPLKACGDTPCAPCAKKAEDETVETNEEPTVESLTAELEELRAERDELAEAQYAAIEVDVSPLKAAINLQSELREALQQVVSTTYGGDDTYVWVCDIGSNDNNVFFTVETYTDNAYTSATFQQAYQLTDDRLSVSLVGEAVNGTWNTEFVAS